MDDNKPRTLTTVEQTCAVLTALKQLDGAGVTELASYLDISKGGVYNHLATLQDNQFIYKENGEYHLGLKLLNYGIYTRNNNALYQVGRGEVDELAVETEEYAHLMTEEFGRGIHLYNARGQKGLPEDFHEQKFERPDHLHLTSTGKAILAHLPDDKVKRIVERHGLPTRTENTVTSKEELFDELTAVRDRGYATNLSEELRGYRALGAPILNQADEAVGAISVSGPARRLDDEKFFDELPELVMERANLIEVYLESREAKMD